MSFIKDFKDFAIKGNLFDIAVGIIIGAAFGAIVSSFVSDILMPPLGLLLNNVDFKDLKFVLRPEIVAADGKIIPAVTMRYGMFIQTVIDFIIIAFSIFLLLRVIQRMKRKEEEKQAAAPPAADIVLLTEIRDLLKEKK